MSAPRRAGRWWKFGLMLLPALTVLALLAYGFTRDPIRIDSPLIGKPAPDFRLDLLDGGRLESSELRGRPVLVNFWRRGVIRRAGTKHRGSRPPGRDTGIGES